MERESFQFGFLSPNSARTLPPHRLAAALEERGYASVWYPEHSHIPLKRDSDYPGGDLPEEMWDMLDPISSLGAAAAVTSTIRLGTGICLPLEHDLIALGKAVATVDHLSNGRLTLGIGAGWNAEELADHRPDVKFSHRYAALTERISALRTIWTSPESGFEGRWDRFSSSRILPSPIQTPLPVAIGMVGPIGLQMAATWADAWCPVDVALVRVQKSVASALSRFRDLAAEASRPGIPIDLFVWTWPDLTRLEKYMSLGIRSFVFVLDDRDLFGDNLLLELDALAAHLSPYMG